MSNLTIEQAYERALNRKIGGIMPYNLTEQSPTIRKRRKKKAKKKPIRKEYFTLGKKEQARERNKRYYDKKKLQKAVTNKMIEK